MPPPWGCLLNACQHKLCGFMVSSTFHELWKSTRIHCPPLAGKACWTRKGGQLIRLSAPRRANHLSPESAQAVPDGEQRVHSCAHRVPAEQTNCPRQAQQLPTIRELPAHDCCS